MPWRRSAPASKHVILEKPPVLDLAELADLRQAAGLVGRRVLVAEDYFYKPLARALRRLLGEGSVGDVLFVHALFEGGIHWIDLLANLGPAVERVEAMAAGKACPLERSAMVAMRYASGGRRHPRLLVGGALATARAPPRAGGGHPGVDRLRDERPVRRGLGTPPLLLFPGLGDIAGRKAMWRDFVEALRLGGEPEFELARASRDLALLQRAAGLGTWSRAVLEEVLP